MLLNISGRTDVIAWYPSWLKHRLDEGFVDVRNPYYGKQVSRIFFEDVDGIVITTKDPKNILRLIDDLMKFPLIIQVTITPYHTDLEPRVPNKKDTIQVIKELAAIVGKDKIDIRFDPLLLNRRYTLSYHIKAFEELCKQLEGYTDVIITSFVDIYKNVKEHATELQLQDFKEEDYKEIGREFSRIATKYGMRVQTCGEERDLSEYGFSKRDCVDLERAYEFTNSMDYRDWKSRNNQHCKCVEMVDIGAYNTCPHLCKYCYANYDEAQVAKNMKLHDEHSTMLIGKLGDGDIVKRRKR